MNQNTNNTQVAQADATQPAQEDIVSRVSQVTTQEPTTTDATQVKPDGKLSELEAKVNEAFIKPEEFAAIKDPVARQFIQRKESEMLSGLNKKFQEVAELRKSLEAEREQLSQTKPEEQLASKYDITTREGLMEALEDPQFSNLVQQLAQEQTPQNWEGTNEQWSMLSDTEKAEFKSLKDTVNRLTNALSKQELEKVDSSIKAKYEDYDSSKVNEFENLLKSGKVSETDRREAIYKILNYENAIKRAYEIAKEERTGNITAKVNATSLDGLPSNQNSSEPLPEKGDKSSSQFFVELAQKKLKELKKQN